MCLSPITLKDRTQVACRGCSLCRDNRINDLLGRCIAEQRASATTLSATLTYAGDSPQTTVLYYKDIQHLMMRLRDAGHKVRYIVAGEYGEAKQRAHWHIILFFKKPFKVPLEKRINWTFWDKTIGDNKEPYHGFTYFQAPDYKGFKYLMKYAVKNQANPTGSKSLAMSKKPPLGNDFFMELAADIVKRGLPMLSPQYSFAEVLDRQGKPRKFWLQGRMRELYLERYCDLWRTTYNAEPPASEWLMERYLDPRARREMDLEAMPDARIESGYLMLGHGDMLVAYDNKTADLFIGTKACQIDGNATSGASVEQQLLNSELLISQRQLVLAHLNGLWGFASPDAYKTYPRQ